MCCAHTVKGVTFFGWIITADVQYRLWAFNDSEKINRCLANWDFGIEIFWDLIEHLALQTVYVTIDLTFE